MAIAAQTRMMSSGPSPWARRAQSFRRLLLHEPLGVLAAAFVVLACAAAIAAPWVTQYDPTKSVADALIDPNGTHWFGTDQFGRDSFSRIIYGTRVSLAVGIVATGIAAVGAAVVGIVSAYFGGWLDLVIQRAVDAVQAIPPLVFLLGLVIALDPSFWAIVGALALRGTFVLSRVVRSAVLSVRELLFIEAARASGATSFRIMFRHILPNIAPILVVLFSVNVAGNMIAEASLSFLGYGLQPPTPTLGSMVGGDSRLYMIVQPYLLIFPIVTLALLVLSLNLAGDLLRDHMDPRLRGR
jgi:peptide/nickel transport system permease protein